MMDGIVVYISSAIILAIFAALVFFVISGLKRRQQQPDGNEQVARGVGQAGGGVLRAPQRVGAARRRGRLQPARLQHRPQDDSGSEGSDFGDDVDLHLPPETKVGAKKLRKLEEKAQRKAQREAEEEERRERKEREEKLERKRKKDDELRAKEEAARAAEEQRQKEVKARQEHEEYLKLKEAFTVDEEGVDTMDEQDVQSLLQEFISYIEQTKVIMLEDLAARFKIKTQDAIDRVKTLQAEGRLSGVIDDRGKFICITAAEYESVARFVRQRGRVSISELADSMNRLIRLNADTAAAAAAASNLSDILASA